MNISTKKTYLGVVDTVVSDAILLVVVSTDALAPVSAANHTAPRRRPLLLRLCPALGSEFGLQHLHR
jgi:hypothetical protein